MPKMDEASERRTIFVGRRRAYGSTSTKFLADL